MGSYVSDEYITGATVKFSVPSSYREKNYFIFTTESRYFTVKGSGS